IEMMAMAEKLRKESTHFTCLNYFQDPCLTFCKHNFCFSCLR
ncbi:hypothetical protein DBR06_SOUSAS25410004, partial [Sousa chinensis]